MRVREEAHDPRGLEGDVGLLDPPEAAFRSVPNAAGVRARARDAREGRSEDRATDGAAESWDSADSADSARRTSAGSAGANSRHSFDTATARSRRAAAAGTRSGSESASPRVGREVGRRVASPRGDRGVRSGRTAAHASRSPRAEPGDPARRPEFGRDATRRALSAASLSPVLPETARADAAGVDRAGARAVLSNRGRGRVVLLIPARRGEGGGRAGGAPHRAQAREALREPRARGGGAGVHGGRERATRARAECDAGPPLRVRWNAPLTVRVVDEHQTAAPGRRCRT